MSLRMSALLHIILGFLLAVHLGLVFLFMRPGFKDQLRARIDQKAELPPVAPAPTPVPKPQPEPEPVPLPQNPPPAGTSFQILNPFANDFFRLSGRTAEDQVFLVASAPVDWFVDNQPVGSGKEARWALERGAHFIEAHSGQIVRRVTIYVQ